MIPLFTCRCEDVTEADIAHAVDRGMVTVEEIKRYTGLGTGPCQGKDCMAALARLMVARGWATPQALAPFTPRAPVEPVSLAALAALDPPPPKDPSP